MYNGKLFDLWAPGGSRCFTFTVYSQSAFNQFYHKLQEGNILEWPTQNEDIYFKYLKCLESRIILIDLEEEGAWEDLMSLSWFKGETLKQKHRSMKFGWLLVTRPSETMEPFDYGLIRIYDEKIREIEIKATLLNLGKSD